MKKNIAIVFGGVSSEHEVSCLSAVGICENIDKEKYNFIMIGVTKNGQWKLTNASPDMIKDGSWIYCKENYDVVLLLNKNEKYISFINGDSIKKVNVDCIFSTLHGKYGEDGCIQGIFEVMGIPYVGCGVTSSAIGFDKAITKELVENINIKQAKCKIIGKEELNNCDLKEEINDYFTNKYPLFVKPAREGSSIGISKVDSVEELDSAIKLGFKCDNKILIEEGIVGREIEVAVIGNNNPKASSIGEIISNDSFYSYDAKYKSKNSKTQIVEDITQKLSNEIKEAAIKIYKKLECKGLSRVDFFLKEDGTYIFNEINTLPGFTPISMYPKLWDHDGMDYTNLISQLIELAISDGDNSC